MTTSPNKQSRGRIVALALIGLLILGLGYLRFTPGDAPVSVPAGAHAGDLTLAPCSYTTESGSYAADCGTLVVPENRANSQSRLIALPVIRIRARSAHPAEPIFYLEGGPGLTNVKFAQTSRFADDHDVVLVGYRGVDGSVRLDCPEVTSAFKHSADFLGEQSFQANSDAMHACADRLTNAGVDLAGYSMAQQVDDLEAARTALGYERVDLLSESAGTRAALIYAWRYPSSIHRSVMIGVNPPGNFLWNPQATDEEIARYAALCAQDAGCSQRTDDLAASMRRTAAAVPDRWGFLPIKPGNVRISTFFGLMESRSEATPFSAPLILDAWLSAAHGDAGGFWLASHLADLLFPNMFTWGEYYAAGNQDGPFADAYYAAGGDHGSILGNPGTDYVWGAGMLDHAWPTNPSDGEYSQMRSSDVETLLIGGTLDVSTPPQIATQELLPYLPNGHQVVLAELGHTGSFWSYQPEAGSRLINTFFDSGAVDASLYPPATVDFAPGLTLTTLAKGLAAIMVGLAVLMVVSLLWMARRVQTRGHFGLKASAGLRSVYPLVLGLGGWFLGLLIVMTFWPTVPLDSELLAVVSMGVPIGLGISGAWVQREWSARTKTAGAVAALGGALLGAWLGFNATGGLLAFVTAIVGAVAGANLFLIALDIWQERLAHQPVVAAAPAPAATSAAD